MLNAKGALRVSDTGYWERCNKEMAAKYPGKGATPKQTPPKPTLAEDIF
jgi:hypothetical protein